MACWCGMTVPDGRLHYPGNDPENGSAHKPADPCAECGGEPHEGPCEYGPDQCYSCGRYAQDGETFVLQTVDTDPGDPEVGPQPSVQDVLMCAKCANGGGR